MRKFGLIKKIQITLQETEIQQFYSCLYIYIIHIISRIFYIYININSNENDEKAD